MLRMRAVELGASLSEKEQELSMRTQQASPCLSTLGLARTVYVHRI
jgi:hypothetical protein